MPSCSFVNAILYLIAQLGPAIESVRIRSSVPRYRPDGSVSPAVSLTSCGACKLTALVSMSCTGHAPADWRRLAQKLSCCPPHNNLSKNWPQLLSPLQLSEFGRF